MHLRTITSATFTSALKMSESNQVRTVFDDFAKIYLHFAELHRHPNGPWKRMTEVVGTAIDEIPNPIILDLASGPGEPAATIARAYPHAHVLSTDFSDAMHEQAKSLTQVLPNMRAKIADMQDLKGFSDSEFDVITCSYGFMFPPDKTKALAEAFRVLKPGGTFVTTTWIDIPHRHLLDELVAEAIGENTKWESIDPLSLSAPGLWEDLVRNAGFTSIQTEEGTYPFYYTSDANFQFESIATTAKQVLTSYGAYGKAREVFPRLALKYCEFDETGCMITRKNVFKLVSAIKPIE